MVSEEPALLRRNAVVTAVADHRHRDWARPASAALSVLLMEVGDFAMLRAMLLGIRSRAERLANEHRSDTPTLSRGQDPPARPVSGTPA